MLFGPLFNHTAIRFVEMEQCSAKDEW